MNPLQEGKTEAKSGLLTSSVTCEICGKVLSKKGHMDRHLRTVHQVELKIRKRGRPKGSTLSEAKKTLKDREVKGEDKDLLELAEYLSTVAEEKENDYYNNDDYDTKQAENTSGVATKLSQNDEGSHGSVTCEICGKMLSKKGHLDRHLKTVHQVEMKLRGRGRPRKGEEGGSSSSEAKNRDATRKHWN